MDRIDHETGVIEERYINEDNYQDQKEKVINLENNCSMYRENCEDLIKMIELVENGEREPECLYILKNYIKKI